MFHKFIYEFGRTKVPDEAQCICIMTPFCRVMLVLLTNNQQQNLQAGSDPAGTLTSCFIILSPGHLSLCNLKLWSQTQGALSRAGAAVDTVEASLPQLVCHGSVPLRLTGSGWDGHGTSSLSQAIIMGHGYRRPGPGRDSDASDLILDLSQRLR